MVAGRRGQGSGEGRLREFGMDMCIVVYSKRITNKELLYSAWDNVTWQPGWEGRLGKDGYLYMNG